MEEKYEVQVKQWQHSAVSLPQMKVKLIQALDFAVKSSSAKDSTKATYANALAGIDEELLLTPIEELKYSDVRLAILRDAQKDSPKRLHARYSLLRTCLKRLDRLQLYRLADRRLVEQDYEIRKPKRPPVKQIGTEVIQDVLQKQEVWSYVFALGCATALRKSDLYETKWHQVKGRQIRAVHGKTERVVDLELGELGLVALNGLKMRQEGEYIIPLRNTRSWETVDRHYAAFLKQFGLTPHDSRRLFAQLLFKKGAGAHVVQRLGAWSDIAMVMRYASSITDSEAAKFKI